jgi:hypothetical protein
VRLAFDHGGQDTAEFADAEEAVAAGVTAVGGKSEPALQKNEGAIFDTVAGNMLNIEIAAAGAVREAFEDGSDPPGMKAPIATVATPGTEAGDADSKVEDSVAVRTKTIVTATLWTNHSYSGAVAQNTEKPVRGQGGEILSAGGVPNLQGATRAVQGFVSRRTGATIGDGHRDSPQR